MTVRDETIAARLRRARIAAGLGSRELDRLAGLSHGHTAMIEARKKPDAMIDALTASKVAKALGVSTDWLVTGEGEEPSAKVLKAAAKKARASAAA